NSPASSSDRSVQQPSPLGHDPREVIETRAGEQRDDGGVEVTPGFLPGGAAVTEQLEGVAQHRNVRSVENAAGRPQAERDALAAAKASAVWTMASVLRKLWVRSCREAFGYRRSKSRMWLTSHPRKPKID